MEYTYAQPGYRQTYQEMRQKPAPRDTFFSLKHETVDQRPVSVATEFVDTDWDEEVMSDVEDNSPRISLQSAGQPSFTTQSSWDEVPTPRSSQDAYMASHKTIEGPRGPHLFGNSIEDDFNEHDMILTMSPMTPKAPSHVPDFFYTSSEKPPPLRNSPFQYTSEELDTSNLVEWTPEMVAQSMLNAGIEVPVADRFIENDINGAILITLKFEDLRELDISSFGIRTRVWHQIQALHDSRPASPRAPTPIEDAPSREARRELRDQDRTELSRGASRRRVRKQPSANDSIAPGESVSIIGIEQVIPKPHVCSKGENCSKFRKQARLIERFQKMNPNVDVHAAAGTVMIAGDAGNPETAQALNPNEFHRPMSDAVPSVVASSDVMGTHGMAPLQYLQEATLRSVQERDPQDNVRHFLRFQKADANEVPPTPPYEMGNNGAPHQGLRRLPKLTIPGTNTSQSPNRPQPPRAATVPPPTQQQKQRSPQRQQRYSHQSPLSQSIHQSPEEEQFQPYSMDKADPRSPDLETSRNPYRFGTPFSEMDVPVTAVALGPVARDASQSVPPDMNYHHSMNMSNPVPRAQSRSSRRPSFPVMPALDENRPIRAISKTPSPQAPSPPRQSVRPQPQQPLQAPPRVNYPWSPVERPSFEKAIPPSSAFQIGDASSVSTASSNGVSYQGPMKKRKTKLLRHEWQDGYFSIKGTRLNMHKDAQHIDRTLEYVDIDDYAIACSSVASTSKLSAAFKRVNISHNREKSDPGAFQFQLIPQDKNTARLRKRDSALPSQIPVEGVNGTGKTHHFAVKNRDERIDWMRELMLAKALKQKGEGFEVSVNGSMI
ncbi:uncharacterized protein J7T54_000059 [Emericellopsis cladophorae]|uniref:Protein pob1 n=1 Tax=Emericellopsis cladophorae TaxID=2686198 RepID=A0A9P9XZ41_9HYPO|nr:uncharacterized protein J7T54_000059 [Emericellopsis cladophorae]KAI6780153.1 hypothetical protein J7T54_000059 [Emericellopsis cladophorae]